MPELQEELGNIDTFLKLSPEARRSLATRLAEHLNGAEDLWEARSELVGKRQLIALHHKGDGLEYVVIPGGRLIMGISDSDIAALEAHVEWQEVYPRLIEAQRGASAPPREIEMPAFLCTRYLVSADDVDRLGDGDQGDEFLRDDARRFADRLGARLPSEAELEWLAREGGATSFCCGADVELEEEGFVAPDLDSGFGLEGLMLPQWADDDWHDSYAGAPSGAGAWRDDASTAAVVRGAVTEGVEEPPALVYALAGYRVKKPIAAEPDPYGDDLALLRLVRSVAL